MTQNAMTERKMFSGVKEWTETFYSKLVTFITQEKPYSQFQLLSSSHKVPFDTEKMDDTFGVGSDGSCEL